MGINHKKKPREANVSNVGASYGLFEVISMFEVWFGVALGLLLASNVALWLKLDRCYQDLHRVIADGGRLLNLRLILTELKTKYTIRFKIL